jgi:hypothetical protein
MHARIFLLVASLAVPILATPLPADVVSITGFPEVYRND